MNFKYSCFGLIIDSQIELPELVEETSGLEKDVTIEVGAVPEHLEDSIEKGVAFEIAYKTLLLDIEGVARYLIKNGTTIIVEKSTASEDNDVRLFILGTCLGALLQQRDILALHASCFKYNDQAVIVCGNSGVGKSSTVNAFRLEGCKVLSDDICPIGFDNDNVYAYSGYPQSKMWIDALEKLNIENSNLDRIRKDVNKRRLPIEPDFYAGKLPINRIYLLTKYGGDDINIIDLKQSSKLDCILKMTFRKYLLKSSGTQVEHFKNSTKLANLVLFKKIRRPHECSIDDLKNAILEDLKKDLN